MGVFVCASVLTRVVVLFVRGTQVSSIASIVLHDMSYPYS